MKITHGGRYRAALRAGKSDISDFSASINPLGPPAGVREAILAAIDEIVHYPDPYAEVLVAKLAGVWNVDPACVLLGNGATDLLHFVARVWPQSRTHLVVPTFSEFHRAWPDASHVRADESWPNDGLLVLTNPVNPTGQLLHAPQRSGPTLVDESFLAFTNEPSSHSANLRLRSLTKFYALPGLRIGALIGPAELMNELRERREPWQVNVLAEAAMIAALEDADYPRRTRQFVQAEAAWLSDALRFLPGVQPEVPSANYVFARLSYQAERLERHMAARHILIRVCTGWPGVEGEAVRVAVRTRAENQTLLDVWKEFVCD